MPFAEIDGARLHYLDVGAGDPLVLLHAFPLHSAMWAPQIACLSSNHRVVAPDLLGFGASDAPAEPAAYTMRRYADDLATLLRHLGIARAVVGGLSMGGYVTFSFLRHHAGMVAALVLADTRAASDTPEVFERRSRQQSEVARDGTAALVEAQLGALLTGATHADRPALIDQIRSIMSANSPAGVVGGLEAMKHRPDVTADLAAVALPTLVLVGEDDATSPPDEVRSWQEAIPGSRLVVLPRAGHLSNLEAPDEFNAAVVDFLEGA